MSTNLGESAAPAFGPDDYPDRRTRDQRAAERVHVDRQIQGLLRMARDDDHASSVDVRLQQRRRPQRGRVQLEAVRRPRRMHLLVAEDRVVLRTGCLDEAAVLHRLAEWVDVDKVPRDRKVACVPVRQRGTRAPRPMPDVVGVLRGDGPDRDVAVDHVIPLAGNIKGAGGPEPSAYAPPFPAVSFGAAGVNQPMVAVLDTGISAEQRSDGYLAMEVLEEDLDLLDDFPPDGLLDAGAGHGPFVTGIVEQVAPRTPITIVRAVDSDGVTTEDELADAMRLAVARGAQILNLSLGTETVDDEPPLALVDVVDDFLSHDGHADVLVVCAAGNGAGEEEVWPAALARDHENVVAVAALDAEGRPARWSTHGEWVGISTIGEGIVSTYVRGTEDGVLIDDPDPDTYGPDAWACWTGTSFAAPQVTGALARLMTESSRRMSPRAALDGLKERGTNFTAAGYGMGVRILTGTGRPSR
jgi:subtilase family protein